MAIRRRRRRRRSSAARCSARRDIEGPMDVSIAVRADTLFQASQQTLFRRTDRWFAGLMTCQWLAGIAAAYWISPRTWAGTASQTHPHVWAAIFLGGAISLFPIVLALTRPGRTSTRHVIAIGQMLTS